MVSLWNFKGLAGYDEFEMSVQDHVKSFHYSDPLFSVKRESHSFIFFFSILMNLLSTVRDDLVDVSFKLSMGISLAV